jgi:hypothetical protein
MFKWIRRRLRRKTEWKGVQFDSYTCWIESPVLYRAVETGVLSDCVILSADTFMDKDRREAIARSRALWRQYLGGAN